MPGENIQSWSVTAADNGNSDTSIEWREGQTRASVNNSARSMMAALAKDRNLKNGSIVTGGTANAQTFTSSVGYSGTIPTGLIVKLKIGPGLTNADGTITTLNMDGIGAVTIKTDDGLDIKGGELVAGSYTDFLWDGTNWIFLYSREFWQEQINGGGGIIIGHQIFNTPGIFSYTPTPGMECCIIECVGGGGGGGSALGTGEFTAGGGGSSGGYSRKYATAADILTSAVVTVGAGGLGGPGTVEGGEGAGGGATSVGALCVANGGYGGTRARYGGAGIYGALAGIGDVVAAGNAGGPGVYLSPNPIAAGNGGGSAFGGGANGVFTGTAIAGSNAGNYGAGGSGGAAMQSGWGAGGGGGSAGVVIITELSGRGAPGRDGADGVAGPIGPAGPAGAGTGDVLVSGTPVAGQAAQWVDASHIRGVDAVTGFTTGDAKLTLKTVADLTWVMMDDGTIGSAASGASTRANIDTNALFVLLFNNVTDAFAPIFTSTGTATTRAAQTNAATAWTANCRMSLTKQLGRALGVAGSGTTLTTRALGATAGEETHTLTAAEMPTHGHGVNDPTHTHSVQPLAGTGAAVALLDGSLGTANDGGPYYLPTGYAASNVSAAGTGISIQSAGSGGAHNVIQPSTFWNVMIKL